ncbi:MAG TPA: PEP/pyruvate-binding domain-containing protein [Rhizomicrobium sp.]|nr:PEP/pyruvate-binding domain-containing protein [Rhizomicrobium sp.]
MSILIGMDGAAEVPPASLAGSKAAGLACMAKLGLAVPPAFVLPTTLCAAVNRGEARDEVKQSLHEGIVQLEKATGRRFGDLRAPLLVSVRSGAERSMPGMMSTVLDVGLNPDSVRGLIARTGNPRLAWDSYRRFIQIYAEVVMEQPAAPFEAALVEMMRAEDAQAESELDSEALETLSATFRNIAAPPRDPMEQLCAAAFAVYCSWDSPRAKEYRRINGLKDLAGTAVTVQAMVFGNAGANSGAGVAFSRNPATGEKELYVDFLFDAQGEDVVAGRRTPQGSDMFARRLPDAARELARGVALLEREARDLQDVEFTIENGKLYFLQTRAAKRTPRAALRVLVDLVNEGIIDRKTGLARAEEIDVEKARITRFADNAPAVASASVACPGVASGRVAFSSGEAQRLSAEREPVILVRPDTATEDVAGFAVADGILTSRGGRTAHAAVVARQMGKVCFVACTALAIDEEAHRATIAGKPLAEGDWISLDGTTGEISLGRRTIVAERPEAELAEIARWRRG